MTKASLAFVFALAGSIAAAQATSPNRQSVNGAGQAPSVAKQNAKATVQAFPPVLIQQGGSLFAQQCAFCHGRDAAGGETGPDLTRSKVVADDVGGNQIGSVVRNGRPQKGMPAFKMSDEQIAALAAFIH